MGAIRYSWPIWLVPTYILPAKERRLLEKFQPDSFKTERQVCVETDGHGYIDSSSDADQEYIYFMGSETSPSLRCKLLTEIIIPSQGYNNFFIFLKTIFSGAG